MKPQILMARIVAEVSLHYVAGIEADFFMIILLSSIRMRICVGPIPTMVDWDGKRLYFQYIYQTGFERNRVYAKVASMILFVVLLIFGIYSCE